VTAPESHSGFSSTKKELRARFLRERQALSFSDWQIKSTLVCEHLTKSSLFQDAKVVLAYLSTRQEPDLSPLWKNDAPSKDWGLPRCVGQDLIWHHCSPPSPEQFQVGTYGILEPIATLPILQAAEADLILVPAVACDRKGFRLGYGGGFYDRLLSNPQWAHKITVGIVFEFAYVEDLPSDEWDYPMQAVCTETGWTTID
jgi:5-formyltetrahydrofolate cyclo-ligase